MRGMMWWVLGVVLLAGCHRAGDEATNLASQATVAQGQALEGIERSFNQDRQAAITQYGVVAVTSERAAVGGVDCLVFNQAAASPMPATLGGLSGWAESLRLRAILGCGTSDVDTLTRYETARRSLAQAWATTLGSLTTGAQVLLRSSKMGQFVEGQIEQVTTESLACRLQGAARSRDQLGNTGIDVLAYGCARPQTNANVCHFSWANTVAHEQALGARDKWAYLSELIARYHMALFLCSSNALNEYMAFHQAVPPALFDHEAFRLRIAVDPIMQCSLKGSYDQLTRHNTPSPTQETNSCAAHWNMPLLYGGYSLPDVFSPAMLKAGTGSWLYDPSQIAQQPERWATGVCEKRVAAVLTQYGINLPPPEALRLQCRRPRPDPAPPR